MPTIDEKALNEFKEAFVSLTRLFGLLCDDKLFKEEYGFTMKEFLSLRRSCANKIREVADHIEEVVHDTGVARTTGGSVAVASGTAAIAGLILAPVTLGASVALTVGGIVGGIASAATTLTAAIIKDTKVKSSAKEVKELLDSLEYKDKVVFKIIEDLQKKLKEMRALYGNQTVMDFIKDGAKIAGWIATGCNIAYKVYNGIQIAKYTTVVIEFLMADVQAMRGFAVGLSAPGFSIFGKTLIVTASTSAKVLSGVFSVLGIGLGIWDIAEGVDDIEGSKHAEAYRKAADELDKQTESSDEMVKKMKKFWEECLKRPRRKIHTKPPIVAKNYWHSVHCKMVTVTFLLIPLLSIFVYYFMY